MEEYAIIVLISSMKTQWNEAKIAPMTVIGISSGNQYATPNGSTKRNPPNIPTFNIIPANNTDIEVLDSAWTSGNQECIGHIGILKAKEISNKIEVALKRM